MAKSEGGRRNWRMILTYFTLGALLLLVYFSREQIIDTFTNIRNVNAWVLIFIVVWQIANYHSYTKLYQGLFGILGKKFEYKPIFKASVELNFVNHIFPSAGVSGFSYFSLRMRQLGSSAAKATLVQTMRFITVFISFQVLLFMGVLMLAVENQASNLVIFIASSLGTLLIVCTWIVVYIVGSKKRIDSFFTGLTKALNAVIRTIRPKYKEAIKISTAREMFLEFHENYGILKQNYKKLKMPILWAGLASLTEILTLYTVYVAFGEYVNFGAIIIAYAIANFAGLISVLPGGIGVYEALMTAVLAAVGVPPATSLPITVMYRVLSASVQLPPGYYLYHKALNDKENPLL